jgi:hypothetical protein
MVPDEDFEGDLTYDNANLLNGEGYRKVPVGSEQKPIGLTDGKCAVCRVGIGHFHEPACEQEECPRCHGWLLECACE